MTLKQKYIFLLFALLIIFPKVGYKIYANTETTSILGFATEELNDDKIYRDTVCFKLENTNKFIELLAIKPGMTILDIGTGTGMHTYSFAAQLKGSGKVFATDVDINCIKYIEKEAAKRNLTNLFPVLVKTDGLDEFYSKQKYDLVSMIHFSAPSIEFIKNLSGLLTPNGRLFMIEHKNFPNFSPSDFNENFKDFARALSVESNDNSINKILLPSTLALFKKNPEDYTEELLKNTIVEDFNKILDSSYFSNYFTEARSFKKDVSFTAEEKKFATFLLISKKTILIVDGKRTESSTGHIIRILNKLLIYQKFRKYLNKDKIYVSSNLETIKNFEAAGYELENEYNDVIPFQYVLVFKVKKI